MQCAAMDVAARSDGYRSAVAYLGSEGQSRRPHLSRLPHNLYDMERNGIEKVGTIGSLEHAQQRTLRPQPTARQELGMAERGFGKR